jgi:hypothetical protein
MYATLISGLYVLLSAWFKVTQDRSCQITDDVVYVPFGKLPCTVCMSVFCPAIVRRKEFLITPYLP